jgi:O-acetyl-ADP-ribose deacetylase (regulator of RNase III)
MKAKFGGTTIELKQGDITGEDADAIVNAANNGLRGGGGVDGAIHRAGGPEIMEECRKIGHCETGDAVITTAGKLKARHVIHTVGPFWRGGGDGEEELLARCYTNSLRLAMEKSLKAVAFPSISTGAYGYPVEKASRTAMKAVRDFAEKHREPGHITFVLFDASTLKAYEAALRETLG